jgi:hypothetical protein
VGLSPHLTSGGKAVAPIEAIHELHHSARTEKKKNTDPSRVGGFCFVWSVTTGWRLGNLRSEI